jgi:serine/threonine protein kinase
VQKHDRYVVVSDGVYDAIPSKNLCHLLAAGDDASNLASRLIDEAMANATQDNATALVLDVLEIEQTLDGDQLARLSELPIAVMPALLSEIDDYRIDALLARTRTHDVCRATDLRTQEPVVIKFARTAQAPLEQIKANIIHELVLSARLHHPQWVVARSAYLRQTALYRVYPFIAGKSLQGAQINRYGLRQLLRFGIELSQLLLPLHQQGVIHADIKPDNIMRGEDGKLYLIDFSVANECSAFSGGQMIGTPNFIAPEIWQGKSPSALSDQFALAATLYQLASGGATPFGEIEAFSQPTFKSYRSLREHRDDLPLWFDLLLQRALHPDPLQRFTDCHAFADALREGMQHGIGVAGPTRRRSYLERDPLTFYQTLSAVLALLLLLSWLLQLH